MQQVYEWQLPDGDTHFKYHLDCGPVVSGRHTYQYNKISAALGMVPEDRLGVAVDVGAHVGFWSYFLALNFRRVISFEPVPELADCLDENLRDLPSEDKPMLTICRMGLSDGPGRLTLMPGGENSGNWRVLPARREAKRTISVMCNSLDRELTHYWECWPDRTGNERVSGRIDFIKVDVEGWELRVLRGAEETIRRDRPVLVVEQKPGNGSLYGGGDRGALALAQSWGMRVLWEKSGDICLGW